ncbi:hypothetical protein [Xenorhabdus cabanillasii]|nr:hypothetical protein [Xenorhabdus sp. Flor]
MSVISKVIVKVTGDMPDAVDQVWWGRKPLHQSTSFSLIAVDELT